MNLAAVDLNLLKAFHALYAERSVTLAGRRIGLSQPAMSSALSRLRHTLKDELFVRGPDGMQPTALASNLAEPIQQILADTERVFSRGGAFDPAVSRRTFRLGLVDIGSAILHPRLGHVLESEAPMISLRVRQVPRDDALSIVDEENVDLVVTPKTKMASRFSAVPMLEETFAVVARHGHPAIGKSLTLKTYVGLPHVLVSSTGASVGLVDTILAKQRLSRRVFMTVPHYLAACMLVADSDLIVTLPRRVAMAFADRSDIAVYDPPMPIPSVSISVIWHRRSDNDPSHRWFRERLQAVAAELKP